MNILRDLFLKIKKSKQDLSELQEIIEKIRVEAKKCKSSHLVGVKLIIKNPTYKYEMKRIIESKKSNGNKKKNSTSEEAKSLLRYGFMTKEETIINNVWKILSSTEANDLSDVEDYDMAYYKSYHPFQYKDVISKYLRDYCNDR